MRTTPAVPDFPNNISSWTALLEVKHAYTNWESGGFWALESDYRHGYTYTNSQQGETQVHTDPCISLPCPSPTARSGVVVIRTQDSCSCLCPDMAQGTPAPQLNAGQESFHSCLTAYIFQIAFFCEWEAVMSWERPSSIRGIGRKHPLFQEMMEFREIEDKLHDGSLHAKYTYVSPGSSKSSFGPSPKPGAVQKALEVPVSETPVIQGRGPQVIKSLCHFDFYLGFSLQRVGTWSSF